MKLTDFERHIDSTILSRGEDYYLSGCVDDIEEIDHGIWQANVSGTDSYQVRLHLKNDNEISSTGCDCPYDWGPICKHEVAALFALREQKLGKMTGKEAKAKKKTMTRRQKLETILGGVSHEELQEFVIENALNHDDFYDSIMIRYAHLLGGGEPAGQRYRKMVERIIIHAGDRYGFVEYAAAYDLANSLEDVLEQADQAAATSPVEALEAAMAIIEAMPDLAQNMDDSDGHTGSLMYSACEMLENHYDSFSSEEKDALFNRVQRCHENTDYLDYGIDDALHNLLINLSDENSDKKTKILNSLDRQIQQAEPGSWKQTSTLREKMHILVRWGKQQEADSLIDAHLDIPEFRKQRVDETINNKDYSQAKELAEKGLEIARQNKHFGTVNDWLKTLLNIAELTANKAASKQLCKELFFGKHHDMAYYHKLKQHYSKTEWTHVYKELLNAIPSNNDSAKARIYAEERDWQELLDILKQERYGVTLLQTWAIPVAQFYPGEILQIYTGKIQNIATNTGRNVYKEVITHLKTVQKISGGDAAVKQMLHSFRKNYRNRPAMMEMLDTAFGK